jgi:hypothetical protein
MVVLLPLEAEQVPAEELIRLSESFLWKYRTSVFFDGFNRNISRSQFHQLFATQQNLQWRV